MEFDHLAADNFVFLRGRLAAEPVVKDLPSGDELAVFRLTVDRASDGRSTAERARVDSLECVSTRARVRRSLERAEVGAVVEVTGAVHRRFWRGPTGPTSRYAIDVTSLRVTRSDRRDRPDRSGAASRARTPASG